MIAEVRERVDRLQIPFNAEGIDPYGTSKRHLVANYTFLGFFYRHYFNVRAHGLEHVPARGRAMLIGNHSGGYAIDGAMVMVSLLLDKEPPRLAQGMAEKFIARTPFLGTWVSRTGHLTGLPEHAERLLADDRLLLVFPEGARGTAKLYPQRHSLVDFGTGFLRLALKMRTPIIPFGFVGGGEALPTILNLYTIGRFLGVPYLPVTPYLAPIPLPAHLEIHYGEPLVFDGDGSEDDETITGQVDAVKARIASLIERGRATRRERLGLIAP